MDLTKTPPRSVRSPWQGIVQLGRAIDKGKAKAHGNLGEYHYNCPMDQAVFGFLGIDADALLERIRTAGGDAEIEAFTRPFVAKKSAAEIENWNREWLNHAPETPEKQAYFQELLRSIDPSRADVTTWADLLDLEEGREVPQRAATIA